MSQDMSSSQSPPPSPGASNAAAAAANVEDEAYEPTYAEAFPELPRNEVPSEAGGSPTMPAQAWSNKFSLSVRSSNITQVFCVPLEERRYKIMNEQKFGEQTEQAKIACDIMAKTGVAIEMSLAKDQSLTVVITGKLDGVMRARKQVIQQLQTQARIKVNIPKEHHRFILGPKGKKLGELELSTATKITIPRQGEDDEGIIISGARDGIEKAKHEIQLISDEQAKLAFERLPIPKIYHPFICGPDNGAQKALQEATGARISIPPPSVMKDEVVVAGEKDGVLQAKQAIMKIYEEKRRKCQTVSVEVRKSQHKYVIGPRGASLSEILAVTGVSVEVPPTDSHSETITLRGEQDKLGPALTMVYSKANSVVITEVEAPAWLHRFVIGRKGANVRLITQELPKVHIEFTDGQDKIVVEGPPEEVEQAQKKLEDIVRDLMSRMDFAEISVEQKYHRHIIGRNGANVTRIKNETGVAIKIPSDTEASNIIRIEGDPAGVQKAKDELLEMVHKMENEKSRDILIEQRFHKNMIGQAGGKIREIRDKFNQVQVTFPEPAKKSDVVTLRGPKNDVDKCFKYLQQLHQDLIAQNYQSDVHIFKQFHKNIIGKGGANIRKIRDETDTRIDLPSENSESDVITITGRKADVDQAKLRIEAIQKELANISEKIIEIPHKFHNSIIGAKGRLIKSIMDECGGVIIRFPPEGSNSDKVTIRGPSEDVENARKQLQELTEERTESSHTVEVRAKPEYHKFLIGRGGANIRKVRDRTGARIVFPSQKDTDQELITIIGKQECVVDAEKELQQLIKDLENIVEGEVNVDPKHHRHFVARRGEVLRQIAEDFGGVIVSFPRSGVKSDRVALKGARDCVDGAKQRILEIVTDLESQVTVECVIPQQYHRTVMGAKGHKVQEVTKNHDVAIKFPDRPQAPAEGQRGPKPAAEENGTGGETPAVNGDSAGPGEADSAAATTEPAVEDATPRPQDIILIHGKKENCEAARDALLALVPVTEEVSVPFDLHRFIIGQKGRDVRRMMEDCDVSIAVPPARDESDIIRVTGAPANVEQARQALADRVTQLEAEKEDRALRAFSLELSVNPSYHPKIIGRRGQVISKVRTEHDVNIQFPERDSERPDVITITGYESNANAAKEAIEKIVQEYEDMTSEEVRLDHRVHSRLIGQRGRGIRKIMDDFKVDIKFPRSNDPDPELVTITGAEDAVLDCKDHLLNMEEEFLQDVLDREVLERYQNPPSREEKKPARGAQEGKGFILRDAPWSKPSGGAGAPDTSSTADFPEFGASVGRAPAQPMAWGPPRKH